MKIKLNDKTNIDLPKLIDSKLLVQANSGGGKSWALRRILEQTHGKVQHIILDPEGEFITLREKYDYILAGKGGDTPADPKTAALLARKLLEHKASAIIDLYELHPRDRKRFVRLFLEALVDAPKELWTDCLVVVDEAHEYVPEKGHGEAESSDAVIGLCSKGRKRGFCAILATQRISKLHKDAAAECNNKLIGRAVQDLDRKRGAAELGFSKADEILSLRSLKPGEFYVFGPAITDEVQKVQVGGVETFHPKSGARSFKKAPPPSSTIKAVLAKLGDLPKEAADEVRTISDLKTENVQLKKQVRDLEKSPVADEKAIEVAVKKAIKETEDRKEFEFFEERGKWLEQIQNWFNILESIGKSMQEWRKETLRPKPKGKTTTVSVVNVDKLFKSVSKEVKASPAQPIGITVDQESLAISNPEQRVLDAIAWMESVGIPEPEKTAVAFLAKYKPGTGGFNNACGALRSKGLVEYKSSQIVITELGRPFANFPDVILTQEELHSRVLDRLDGPGKKILTPLLEIYPEDISDEDLAERSGYVPGTGGFNNAKGKLRSLGIVDYPAPRRVRATDVLFPDI